MLNLIWNAISGNKIVSWAVLTLGVVAAVVAAYTTVKSIGAEEQQSKQLKDALNSLQREYNERAKIESMRSIDARRQLRERWSAN